MGPQLDEGDVSLPPRFCGLEDDPEAHEAYESAAEQLARPDRASRGGSARSLGGLPRELRRLHSKLKRRSLLPENAVTLVAASLAFIASLIATVISLYNARFRRFALERWWDRKAQAYAEVIGSLVSLTYSLDRWVEDEYRQQTDNQYTPSSDIEKTIRKEYADALTRIERAATEGNYILSERAAAALAVLIKDVRDEKEWVQSSTDVFDSLQSDHAAAKNCLKTIREEAKSDLQIK